MARVLLVDDDIAEISAVKRMLSREGHQAVLATSIADALALAAQERPTVVIVAAACESGGGLALARRLLAEEPRPAVLLLGEVGDLAPGAVAVPQPLDPALLAAELRILTGAEAGPAATRVPLQALSGGSPEVHRSAAEARAVEERRAAAEALELRAADLRRERSQPAGWLESPAEPAPPPIPDPADGAADAALRLAEQDRLIAEIGSELDRLAREASELVAPEPEAPSQEEIADEIARRAEAEADRRRAEGEEGAAAPSPAAPDSELLETAPPEIAPVEATERSDAAAQAEATLPVEAEAAERAEATLRVEAEAAERAEHEALARAAAEAAAAAEQARRADEARRAEQDRAEETRRVEEARREEAARLEDEQRSLLAAAAASAPPPEAPRPPRAPGPSVPGAGAPEPEGAEPEPGEPPAELAAGTLAEAPMPRLLALAARSGLTGRIDFGTAAPRSVYFEEGRVVGATSGAPNERVEQVALRLGLLTREQHRQAVPATAGLTTRRAALALLEAGFLKPDELTALVRRRTEEVVFSLCGETAGPFRYAAARVPAEERIALSRATLHLAVEGVRRRWMEPRLAPMLGEPSTLLAPAPHAPSPEALGLSPAEARLAALADGLRTLDEVLADSPLDPLSTRQLLAALVTVGALVARFPGGPARVPAARAIDLARLREKLDQVRRADYFTILGLSRQCSPHEVRDAAERLLAEFEPNRFHGQREPGLGDKIEEVRRVVAQARHVLADTALRADYVDGLGA